MPASAKLLSIATANAPNVMTQTDVVRVAQALFRDRCPGLDRMLPVFDTAGIRTRQSAMPLDWYLTPRSWPERTQAYLDIAVGMFARAAEAALDQAGLKGSDVDVVITVSSTGIATPSLEARAMARMGFRSDAARVPVFGLGCAGGATASPLREGWPRPRRAP